MPRFNLIKYGNIYLKKSASLLKCCKDKPAQKNSNGNIARFNEANVPTYLFKRKEKQQIKQITMVQNMFT